MEEIISLKHRSKLPVPTCSRLWSSPPYPAIDQVLHSTGSKSFRHIFLLQVGPRVEAYLHILITIVTVSITSRSSHEYSLVQTPAFTCRAQTIRMSSVTNICTATHSLYYDVISSGLTGLYTYIHGECVVRYRVLRVRLYIRLSEYSMYVHSARVAFLLFYLELLGTFWGGSSSSP